MHEPIPNVPHLVLPAELRRLHRTLLQGLLTTGTVPCPDVLGRAAGVAPAVLPARLRALVAADYAALDAEGRLVCLYPLSAVPTPHVVLIEGQRRHAMCAIDALEIPAMLNRVLGVEGVCAACGAPIRLAVRPGWVAVAEPATAVIVARRDDHAPAATACCPFTVFACGEVHGQRLAERRSGASLLSLGEALTHAEALFGDLLQGDILPAHRRRWGSLTGKHYGDNRMNTPE